MKGRTVVFLQLLLLLLFLAAAPVFAAESHTIEVSDYTFTHEYDPISLPSYKIDGQVYAPLHVFSDLFDVTVEFDEETESIHLDFGADEGGAARLQELSQFVKKADRSVRTSPHKLFVQGNQISMPMVLVDGYNFLQIDTIAEGYGLRTVIDDGAKTIALTQDQLFGSPYLPQYKEYLANHQIAVQTNNFSAGALSGAEFDPYKVYLIGEQHGIAKNFEIQLYFIKYFYNNQDVRYIISEDGFCSSMLLNRYLETGDAAIIDGLVKGSRGSSAYSKEYYEFYEKLYQFNQTLPKDQRLFFVGIDVQHNPDVGIDYLISLFDDTSAMPQPVSAALAALNTRSDDKLQEAVDLAEKNKDVFEAYFGDQMNIFQLGLRSIVQGKKFYEAEDFELREQYIHDNLRDCYAAWKIEKCFGMFGGAHTQLNGSFGEISNLASYMNNEHGPTKGMVCSIMTNYIDSFYMDPETGNRIPVTYSLSQSLSRILDQTAKTDLDLFPLAQKGSIFEETGVTQMFQYYLCVKDSPAATPYGELAAF